MPCSLRTDQWGDPLYGENLFPLPSPTPPLSHASNPPLWCLGKQGIVEPQPPSPLSPKCRSKTCASLLSPEIEKSAQKSADKKHGHYPALIVTSHSITPFYITPHIRNSLCSPQL
eukprot:RCo002504